MRYVVGKHIPQRFYLWRQKPIDDGRRQGSTYAKGHRTKRAIVDLPLHSDLVPSNVQAQNFKASPEYYLLYINCTTVPGIR